jgi:uncharacterized membrane protein HdeD (DUF308 family)
MPTTLQPTPSSPVARAIHDHWRVFIAEGVVLILLGFAAIAVPLLAGVTVTVFLGWIFLFAGVLSLIATWRAHGAPGFGWALVSGIAAIVAGVLLLWNPLAGLVSLTSLLTAYFIVDGIFMIVLAIAHRSELSGRWEWILINGIIDLILAAVIIAGLPGTLAWALGLIVGIDLVYGGTALVALALAARKSA